MDKRTVLITGAYGGMGRAAARLLAESGYRVFALDRAVGEACDGVVPITADVTDEESIRCAYEHISHCTDGLDAIVHFAGIYMMDSLVEMETAAFERIMKINLEGAFLINKVFTPMLRCGSRIVITTSELAPLDPLPFTGIYAISKAALEKYAYSLRMELQLKGIRVSVLRAGAVATDMLGASTKALDDFCESTQQYAFSAQRFKRIVEGVEARKIQPIAIAKKVRKILKKRNPGFAYAINRNPLLLILNALPKRLQLWIIKKILKS